MAEAEYWRFTVARDCQKKNTSENHSECRLQFTVGSGQRSLPSAPPCCVAPATACWGMILLLLLATGRPTAALITVSCVGDSITVADGNECYPNQLAKLLGSGYNVTNRGVSGHTMLNSGLCASGPGGSWRRPCLNASSVGEYPCSGNCSYWATPQFQATLDASPDIITIMLGTNDAKYLPRNRRCRAMISSGLTRAC